MAFELVHTKVKVTALDYAAGFPHQEGDERHDNVVALMVAFMNNGVVPETIDLKLSNYVTLEKR